MIVWPISCLQIVQWTINHYTVIVLKRLQWLSLIWWTFWPTLFNDKLSYRSFPLEPNCEWNCEADRKMSWKRNEFDGSFKQQPPAAHSQSLLLWKILIIPCTLLYCHNTIKVWIQSKRRGKRCNNYVFWKKALLLLSVVSQIHITSAHYASFPTFCLDDKSVYHTVKTDGYVLGKDKAVSVQFIPKVIKPFQAFSFQRIIRIQHPCEIRNNFSSFSKEEGEGLLVSVSVCGPEEVSSCIVYCSLKDDRVLLPFVWCPR